MGCIKKDFEVRVALAQGGAVVPYLGLYATMFRPFTVQGWVKNPSGPLCGTWDDTTEGGWRLTANGDAWGVAVLASIRV